MLAESIFGLMHYNQFTNFVHISIRIITSVQKIQYYRNKPIKLSEPSLKCVLVYLPISGGTIHFHP
jgi:hypothetical protein